jgi:hypothetical protein
MLQTTSAQSTFPCQNYFVGGSCRAYTQNQCIIEMAGPGSNWGWGCNYGTTYCSQSNYCGEPLYLQKSS